jgi:hypothetical protein
MGKKPIGKFLFLWISIAIFLFIVIGKYVFVTLKNTPEQNVVLVEKKLSREIESVETLISALKMEIENAANPTFKSLLKDSKYPYFIFKNRFSSRRVFFWSNNIFTPKPRDIMGDFKLAYLEITKGKYIARKEQINHENMIFEIVVLIPLEEKSAVINEYLKNTYNKDIFTDAAKQQ